MKIETKYTNGKIVFTSKDIQWIGFNFAFGVLQLVAIIIIISFGIAFSRNLFDVNTDDSDLNGWNRSGLMIHTDHKTGIQYLSDGRGGLIKRTNQ